MIYRITLFPKSRKSTPTPSKMSTTLLPKSDLVVGVPTQRVVANKLVVAVTIVIPAKRRIRKIRRRSIID